MAAGAGAPRGGYSVASLVVQGAFVAICIVLIIVNVKHSQGCRGYDSDDAALRQRALEHRLVVMEGEVRENSKLLHDFLEKLGTFVSVAELAELRGLKRECHAEAESIVAALAESPPPPMPTFTAPGGGDEFGVGGDDVYGYKDDVFEGGATPYGEVEQGGYGDDFARDLPSTEERSAKCKDWRSQYAVSPGVSWGTLPLDLQATWRDYDCDIFLQESVQGMLADGDARAAKELENRVRVVDDYFDDVVGDVESLAQ